MDPFEVLKIERGSGAKCILQAYETCKASAGNDVNLRKELKRAYVSALGSLDAMVDCIAGPGPSDDPSQCKAEEDTPSLSTTAHGKSTTATPDIGLTSLCEHAVRQARRLA